MRLHGSDYGGVDERLGPFGRVLDEGLPLAGQAHKLLLLFVKVCVHAVLKVGRRRDLDARLLLLGEHGGGQDGKRPSIRTAGRETVTSGCGNQMNASRRCSTHAVRMKHLHADFAKSVFFSFFDFGLKNKCYSQKRWMLLEN